MAKLPENAVRLGLLARPFGVEGEIRLQLDDQIEQLLELDFVFVAKSGGGQKTDEYLPWFVVDMRDHRDEAIRIRLEGLDSPEAAREICGRDAWVKPEVVQLYEENASQQWLGYELLDQNGAAIGKIQEIIEMPHQALAKLQYKDREVLIPIVSDTLIEVLPERATIQVEITEGLLDL